MMHRALALVFLLSLSVPPSAAPQGQSSFKVQVNYVEVTARVTDADGTFVAGLKQNDFEVLEDGRPQKIADFTVIDLPTAGRTDQVPEWLGAEPDVRTNTRPFDGRVYVLVLDTLHVSAERSADVRRLARRFLEGYFADGDMAAIVNTTGAAEPAQELTTSRSRLLAAADRFMGSKGNGDAVFTTSVRSSSVARSWQTMAADDVLSSLKTLTQLLSGVQGRRKAIVFISEGPSFCLDSQLKSGARGALNQASQALVAAASRGNVAIYGLDPRGLDPSIGDCDLDAGIQSLRSLSEGTGGSATFNSNNFDAGFDRIRQENSRYYILGYYATDGDPNGAFRKIEVRTRRPGLRVEARQGYTAPRPSPAKPREADAGPGSRVISSALLDAMDSVLPVSGLRIAATAVPFRGEKPGAELLVSVVVDGRDITFRPADGQPTGGLEFALGTMNSRGEQGANQYELVQLPLEEKSRATVTGFGLRIVRKVGVAPGRHQLRVGVLDRPTGRAGVVHLDVLVPDYRKTPFDLSGVLVTSSLAGRVPTARGGPLEQLQRQLPGPPALTRGFNRGEELVLYAELYGEAAGTTGPAVVASVLDEGGREVHRQDQPPGEAGASPGANGGRGAAGLIAIRQVIPLRGFEPGRYLLRLEARTGSGKPQTVRRDVLFTIVP